MVEGGGVAEPVSVRPRSRTGGGAPLARNPYGEIDSLEAIEALKRRHAEELQWVLRQELAKEKARGSVLASERSKTRRETMEAVYEKERVAARDRIMSLKSDNDKVLAAHMVRLGFAR